MFQVPTMSSLIFVIISLVTFFIVLKLATSFFYYYKTINLLKDILHLSDSLSKKSIILEFFETEFNNYYNELIKMKLDYDINESYEDFVLAINFKLFDDFPYYYHLFFLSDKTKTYINIIINHHIQLSTLYYKNNGVRWKLKDPSYPGTLDKLFIKFLEKKKN
jgi:hypothetical protein